ncbi:hypothetical protein KFE25_000292 [Diacronema lutheri]|uniref:Adenylate kinase n=1 Tax=Diacronema lutheri TaxID=2081491 RepID=A0A8J6C918_DIALT|nr:hypothetical protein KFE25_000292 [Diacronema lutheri]
MRRGALATALFIVPQTLAFSIAARGGTFGPSRIGRAARLSASAALANDAVVFVLGGPGSGKGTQCELLHRAHGFAHLSAGELLRAEASKPTPLGERISRILADGQIVPSSVTVELLRHAMAAQSGPFLIDGFPRSLENLQVYEQQCDGAPCAFMLYLDLSEDEMCARLLERGQSSGRSDDNLPTIRKRFRTFHEQTLPVLELVERRGLLRRVRATGSPAEVFAAIQPLFSPLARQPA